MIEARIVKEAARSFGIDDIRITTAEPFLGSLNKHTEQKNEGLFTDRKHRHFHDIERFYDPGAHLPGARTIIAACQCYLTDENEDRSEPGNPHGRIARYTWRNHYRDLKNRLTKLGELLHEKHGVSYITYSNGPIAEKPIAQRGGIGYYGKHSIILNPTYGSWIVLGELITDMEMEPDTSLDVDCGNCTVCMEGCPTNAIKRPYIIDRTRCIQELTNWSGMIPDEIARVWDNRLYGCTTCQEICPRNRSVQSQPPRTEIGLVGPSLPLFDILSMPEDEYRKRFSQNQITARWINFTSIQRNALIALANIGDTKALPLLEEYAKHQNDILGQTAIWALKRLNNG